jgi:hypothetical protein
MQVNAFTDTLSTLVLALHFGISNTFETTMEPGYDSAFNFLTRRSIMGYSPFTATCGSSSSERNCPKNSRPRPRLVVSMLSELALLCVSEALLRCFGLLRPHSFVNRMVEYKSI